MLNCLQRLQTYWGSWQSKQVPLKAQTSQSKAEELTKELLALGYPHNEENQATLTYYRNSFHVIHNVALALNEYAKNGDLEAKIKPSLSAGQGATLQPSTVKETFQAALDPTEHGGIQQTMAAIKKAHEHPEVNYFYKPEHYKVLQVCEKICLFIKEKI